MNPRRAAAPVIATLTLNPAVDLSASVDRLEPERKLRCRDLRWDPGGGGINVARVIRRLGGRTVAVFAAGGANGARLQALLAAERVPAHAIPIRAETREDFTARELATGDQYRFVMPGPVLTPAERRRVLKAVTALDPAPQILVASGSLPPEAPPDIYGQLARGAAKAGVKLALDASGPALKAGLEAGVWLVKPNQRELEELCRALGSDPADHLGACRSLVRSGAAQIVALSLGAKGALLVTEAGAWRAPPVAIAPVSTIGAGDSFMAGLVWGLAHGRPPQEALRWAAATASATLLAAGTGLCRRADVLNLSPAVRVEVLARDLQPAV